LEPLEAAQAAPSEIGLFVVEGGTDSIVLDGMYMKNVVLRNAKVIYEGGPVRLENVYFIKCSFTFASTPTVLAFEEAVLQTASVNFSIAAKPS
jgi:hypothetical protein